jgi:hypothetical protein
MTGQEVTLKLIIEHILAVFHANILEGFDSSFVPNVFTVYLEREDRARLHTVESRVREQAIRALNKELAALNRPAPKLLGIPLPANKTIPHELLGEWKVEFRTNEDDDRIPNRILVLADVRDDTGKASEKALLEGSETVRVALASTEDDGRTSRTPGWRPAASSGEVYATIHYRDDTGEQTFSMTKDLIKAGRGGRFYLVDLKLMAKKDVSQEHIQIRRDPATGKFYIKDLSRFGTWVNGKQVKPGVERNGTEMKDLQIEEALPESSTINLADVISLEFKAAKKR